MLDHLGFDVSDITKARAFYEKALAPLGITVLMALDGTQPGGWNGLGMGKDHHPFFWIGTPPERVGLNRPLHVAFVAQSRKAVDDFYAAAIAAGGKDNGPPGIRAHYHPSYYAAFVFDPDGHNIEAVCHAPA